MHGGCTVCVWVIEPPCLILTSLIHVHRMKRAPRVNLPHFAAFHYYRNESNIPYTHIHVGEIERGGGFKYHSYLPWDHWLVRLGSHLLQWTLTHGDHCCWRGHLSTNSWPVLEENLQWSWSPGNIGAVLRWDYQLHWRWTKAVGVCSENCSMALVPKRLLRCGMLSRYVRV